MGLDHRAPEQPWQAYFGRRVTSTRNWAGTTSRPSDTSSPILVISPQPQGHSVVSGSMIRSMRGEMLREMAAVAVRRAVCRALSLQRTPRLLLRGLEHALGQLDIFER